MDVGTLRKHLINIPDGVQVYREADHGQTAEKHPSFTVTGEKNLPYYAEDVEWQEAGTIALDEITAICIG